MVTTTSVCSAICSGKSPTCLSGPAGMRTSARSSMQVGVWHQREEPRALDRGRELALVAGRGAGDAGRDDAAVLVDEVLEDVDGLVVDPFDLLGGEAAELAAPEQRPLPAVLLVLGLALELALSPSRWCHVSFLPQIRWSSRS